MSVLRNFSRSVVIGLIFVSFHPASASQIPTQDLLNYFSGSCKSRGDFTASALAKTSAIISFIQAIENDPDCAPLTSIQSQMRSIDSLLKNLNQLDDQSKNYIAYKSQEQAILSALAGTSDPATIQNLNQQLAELAQLMARAKVNQQYSPVISLVQQTNEVLAQSAQHYRCLAKRPSLLSDLSGLASQVGGVATLVNPALGFGISGSALLMSNVLQGVRNARFAIAEREFTKITRQEAFSCVLESLTNDYCQTDTTLKMIDWKLNRQGNRDFENSDLAAVVRMMDRESPAFLKWLDRLRGSTDAMNSSDAKRVSDLRVREATLDNALNQTEGTLNERAATLSSFGDYTAKLSYFKNAVMLLVATLSNGGMVSSSSPQNPLFELYSPEVAYFYLVGIPQDKIPMLTTGSRMYFSDFDPRTAYPSGWPSGVIDLRNLDNLKFDLVKNQLKIWVTEARKITNAERAQFAYPDLRGVFQDGFDSEAQNARYPSEPFKALEGLIEFTRTVLAKTASRPEYQHFLSDTLSRLNAIYVELLRFKGSNALTEDEMKDALGVIYQQANLSNGTLLILNRLDTLVRYGYVILLQSSRTPEDQRAFGEALAADRFTSVFSSIDPSKTLADFRTDVERAKTVYQTTFNTFVEQFQKEIRKVLEYYIEQEKKTKDPAFQFQRAQVCAFLVQSSEWPSKIPFSYCDGLSVQIVKDGPRTSVINQALLNSAGSERSCLYRNLQRDTNIYTRRQIFGSQSNSFRPF